MTVTVLVPWRAGDPQRERLWDWCYAGWKRLGVDVCVGLDPGLEPFNVSRAFNHAASRAHGQTYVLVGADLIPDAGILHAAAHLEYPWQPLYAGTGEYGPESTDRILAGGDPSAENFHDLFDFCTGILAVQANTWREIGGMDERFNGWGCEDTALRCALQTIWPDPPEPVGTARALFHPRPSRDQFDRNAGLIHFQYEPAIGDAGAMRHVLADAYAARHALAS